jgi:DNA polymerase zeta
MTSQAPPLASLRGDYVPPTLPTAVPPGVVPASFPVLRIFGTTTARQKVCANVHLAYPYFYVPFPMDSMDPLRPERVVRLCQRFAVSLNHAICLALRQNPTGPTAMANFAGGTDPRHLHVLSVVLVKGIPFYGYHVGYAYWLKVSLANPARVRVAVEQLHKPVVLGKVWQPHEAHLSHVLQFMCDFDLYGCGFLDLAGGLFRHPLPEPGDDPEGWITTESVPAHMAYPPNVSPARETHTALEIDVLPHQILNRRRLAQRPLHHDFVELLHQPLHPEEKLVPAMKELWEDERRRRAARGLGTSEAAMLPVSGGGRGRSMAELGYKIEGDEGGNKGGDWRISDELWDILEERMGAERRRRGRLTFDQVSRALQTGANGERKKYDKWIMTAFEAVSAGWPKRATQTPKTQRTQRRSSPPTSQAPPCPPPEEEAEEPNPFEFATQASQNDVEVEVDAAEVQEDHEEEEEPGEREHLAAVRGAEAFRATQAAIGDDDISRFLKTQVGEASRASTPARETPSRSGTAHNTRSGGSSARRRAIEEAGFGDLSSLAMSSVRLSSPNPYAPSTPTRPPNGQSQSTPRSLVRTFFARHSSPVTTPTKPRLSPNTVVLPASKRSFTKWTPSPQDVTHPPSSPLRQEEEEDVPMLTEIKAPRAPELPPPNAQPSPLIPSSTRKHVISPTLLTGRRHGPSPTILNTAADATPTQRPKKRVRLSSPTQPFPVADPSQSSQTRASGGETSNSSAPDLASDAWTFADPPPTKRHVVDSMASYGLDMVEYPTPFYSNPADVPPRPKAFAGRVFHVKTDTVTDLPPFEGEATPRPWLRTRREESARAKWGWEYGAPPPCKRVVVEWCAKEDAEEARIKLAASQLAGPTQKNKYGFKLTQRSTRREQQNMSVLLLEVFGELTWS